MTMTLADKAREGRRAALAALNARTADDRSVVSIFDRVAHRRQTVPQFHSIRSRVHRGKAIAQNRATRGPMAA
ncbi:hypothetical protein [Sinisalibacter aestuarii]|uniref:Uncharacterized protein n=1 Tax=Sinisalibacter aestuarii TaxID=2949426 RepID=A0ABQ5LMN5_9RHOB|nr:hypothetical protein [Sinisalibacter aestuarii]GKY86282.1 hypothetical protein STA1M1_01510 [Sinisalibacter aestuarii]